MQNGRHALQVGFATDAFCPALNVAINTEQPIVDVAITSEAADAKSITIGGIAASKLQDPAETLKIDVFFDYGDFQLPFSLPVERKLDDEGRIYFEFEANVQGLPAIAADDPKYAAPFFAFKVSDQAGNEFGHAMSYAQFVAPGMQRIKANNMADIQVQKFADGPAEIGKIAFVVAPPSPLAEYHGKPAIQLSADLHGENLTQLRWVSELSQAAGHPVPTLVFRDDRHLAVVVDSDQYFDKNPPLDRDVHYKVRQFDQDGQPYDSNIATILARETPTPPAAIVSAATPIISPTPTNTPAPEPTAANTPKPTTALLTVRSNVRDDSVFIDGEERGATPLNVELPIGRHTIRVEKMGYVSFEQALDLQAAYTLRATLETKQTPSLTDTPTPEPTPTMKQTPVPRTTHGKSQPLSRHLTPAPVPTATQTKQPEPPPIPPSSEGLEVSSSCWENETPDTICKEETTGMEFVYVPGGCFQMGCGRFDTECYDDEKPRHKICLDGFWMGRYEVTQTQWKKIMENSPSSFKGADHPVEGVSWNDAQAFLQKLNTPRPFPLPSRGFRLPTEAEWEYACRAGTQTVYSFGDNQNQLGTYAWYSENSGGETHSVGQKQQNAFGLYDMHGNVYEWVADTWHDNYNGTPVDGKVWGNLGDVKEKLIRGGAWSNLPSNTRCSVRDGNAPDDFSSNIGFRVAVSRTQ